MAALVKTAFVRGPATGVVIRAEHRFARRDRPALAKPQPAGRWIRDAQGRLLQAWEDGEATASQLSGNRRV